MSIEAGSYRDRAQPESLRGRTLSISLTVKDLQQSLKWYRDALGFIVDREYERDGKVFGISLKAGVVSLLINQDDGKKGTDRVKGEGISFMITTAQSVDEIAQRVKDSGGTLDMEPTDMRWGTRAFRLRDPDGFKITISSERT